LGVAEVKKNAPPESLESLRVKGVGFRSLTEVLDTTTAQVRLVFHMFGALAEFECNLIRERTQAGLAAARRAAPRPNARSLRDRGGVRRQLAPRFTQKCNHFPG
jgi:DNA invertase Pin-like site-specific DNA recombinase